MAKISPHPYLVTLFQRSSTGTFTRFKTSQIKDYAAIVRSFPLPIPIAHRISTPSKKRFLRPFLLELEAVVKDLDPDLAALELAGWERAGQRQSSDHAREERDLSSFALVRPPSPAEPDRGKHAASDRRRRYFATAAPNAPTFPRKMFPTTPKISFCDKIRSSKSCRDREVITS